MEYSRPLDELRRADEPRFGGKSASLGELLAAGIPVPPGFALAVEAMAPDGMPEPVRAAIARGYAALGDERVADGDAAVAVRSSAVGEDSAEATFAGQQETFLWVRGIEDVCARVADCWASLWSDTAVAYRERLGAAAGEPAMGVAVQRMVDAEVSGVMFTCNPVSGDPSMIAVNASWGLGLAVVGGEVTPDDFLVSKVTGEVVRENVHTKDVEYVPDPAGAGVLKREVPGDRRDAPCIDAGQIGLLAGAARTIHAYFGAHQDIEWAVERGTGALFILQSRPVTTLKRRETPATPSDAMSLVMKTFGAHGT
jgi:pyruvate,water dikinase